MTLSNPEPVLSVRSGDGFSAKQVQALQRNLDHRTSAPARPMAASFSYIEGWYAISEANRIFGFDGWNRETLDLAVCSPAKTVACS